MKIREYASHHNFKIVGKLKRTQDVYYGVANNHYPLYIDEAGNEYCMEDDGKDCACIVSKDGDII